MERGCRSERWTYRSVAEGVRLFIRQCARFGVNLQDSKERELQLMPRIHRTWGSLGLTTDLRMTAVISRVVVTPFVLWIHGGNKLGGREAWKQGGQSGKHLWGQSGKHHLQNHPWLWFSGRAPQTVISVSLVPTWGLRPGVETLAKDITPCLGGVFNIVRLLCVCECAQWGGNNYKPSKKSQHHSTGFYFKAICEYKVVCVFTHSIRKLLRAQWSQFRNL